VGVLLCPVALSSDGRADVGAVAPGVMDAAGVGLDVSQDQFRNPKRKV
jgi:hypothetical protein